MSAHASSIPSPLSAPSKVFGPPAPVVIATLVAAFVFAIVLEFLVLISMVGQRLWRDPRFLHDLVFSLPLILWALIVAATIVLVLRILTAWLTVDARSIAFRGLFRRSLHGPWSDVQRVVAVRDIVRPAAGGVIDGGVTTFDGIYVLLAGAARPIIISGRFFSAQAQHTVLRRAEESGIRIEHIDTITPRELSHLMPHAQRFVDRRPGPVLALLAIVYVAQNVLTFSLWGL